MPAAPAPRLILKPQRFGLDTFDFNPRMVWIGRALKEPPVPTGASQLKMAPVLQGHESSRTAFGISLNTGAIWTGFLSRFRDSGCVSFGLGSGVDCIIQGKEES